MAIDSPFWFRGALVGGFLMAVAWPSGCATARSKEVKALIVEIRSADVKVREAAFKRASEVGPMAIQALAQAMCSEDRGVAKSATMALERIVYHCSRPKAGRDRAVARAELIRLTAASWPPVARKKAIDLLSTLGGDEAVRALAGLLGDEDVRDPARRALQRINTRRANEAILRAAQGAEPAFRAALIDSLGHNRYKPATPTLIKAAGHSDEKVQLSAIYALAWIGDKRAESVLAEAMTRGPERISLAAFDAYMRLGDTLALSDKAAARRIYEDGLAKATGEHQRCAALVGIGRVGQASSVAGVLPSLGDVNPKVRAAAIACVIELPDARATGAAKAAMADAGPLVKSSLLRVVAGREGGKATSTLKAATKDPSAEVRVTAYELLGELDDPALAPTLLEAARTGSDAIKPVALRSYLQLADHRAAGGNDAEALQMYHAALELAVKSDHRRQALAGMAHIASPKSLPLVEPLLEDEIVRSEAMGAYIAIAGTVARTGKRSQGIEMLEKVIDGMPPLESAEEAAKVLRELGVQVDLARRTGFITHWWMIGPFPNKKKSAWDKAFFPEREIELTKTYEFGGKPMRWQAHHTGHVQGVVDLKRLFDPHDHVAAYAYAEVTVPQAQHVLLKMGSDDDIVCWLNDERIHGKKIDRGIFVDDDVVEAKLKRGTNRILLKILQGGGGWGYCLRITDRENRALKFEQRTE